jgi:hypothetical protein
MLKNIPTSNIFFFKCKPYKTRIYNSANLVVDFFCTLQNILTAAIVMPEPDPLESEPHKNYAVPQH